MNKRKAVANKVKLMKDQMMIEARYFQDFLWAMKPEEKMVARRRLVPYVGPCVG